MFPLRPHPPAKLGPPVETALPLGTAEHRWRRWPACQDECEDLCFLHFINITEPIIWELGKVPREIPGSRMTQVLVRRTLDPLEASGSHWWQEGGLSCPSFSKLQRKSGWRRPHI